MNLDNVYYGTLATNIYKFIDMVTGKDYSIVLSGGVAVLSGENEQVAMVNADQVKDVLDLSTVSAYCAIPSLPLISVLND